MDQSLEKYRSYLAVQARVNLHPFLRRKLGASDLVQETLLEAHRDRDQFRGRSEGQRMAWLKQILSRNLKNAARDLRRHKRDVGRERALEDAVNETCLRLESWLAASDGTPSEIVSDQERFFQLAESLQTLPADWQEALVLRYWQGLKLEEIARRMERSEPAVAGLLHRGLSRLRAMLARLEGS